VSDDLRVDVAMAVCDGERYLQEQLRSIADQRRPPTRLLVRDDGSIDRSPEVLRRFAAEAPFPVQILSGTDTLGPVRSFEAVLEACSADIVVLSDQDDRWDPSRLNRLVDRFATGDRVSLAYTDGRLVDAAGDPTGATIWEAFAAPEPELVADPDLILRALVSPFVPGCTMAISGALLEAALPFPGDLSTDAVGMEHDGWLVGLGWAHGGVVALPEPLIDYRIHPGQQIGLPARATLRTRIIRTGGPVRHHRTELARRVAAARLLRGGLDRLASTDRTRRCAGQLDALIAHLDARRELPTSLVERARVVRGLWRSGGYERFSSGRQSAVIDLLQRRSQGAEQSNRTE
jgi:glycosyltransferase involved in cell wall biosynthesis